MDTRGHLAYLQSHGEYRLPGARRDRGGRGDAPQRPWRLGFSELLGSFTLDGPGAALGTALGLVYGGLVYAASRLPLRLGVLALGRRRRMVS